MGAPDEAQLAAQRADDRRLDDHEDQPERGRADRRARPQPTDAPGGQRGEAEHAVAGEQAHGDHRERSGSAAAPTARRGRWPEGDDAGAEERDRDVQRAARDAAATAAAPRRRRPAQPAGAAVSVTKETNEPGTDDRPRSRSSSSARSLVACSENSGSPVTHEVDQRPHQRRGGGQREQVERAATRTTASRRRPAPRPPGAAARPARAAAMTGTPRRGARGLERRRPQHEREERHVDVGARRVEQEGEARGDEGGAGQRPATARSTRSPTRKVPQASATRQSTQTRTTGARRRSPTSPTQRADREVERVLGRRGVGLEVGLHAVQSSRPQTRWK